MEVQFKDAVLEKVEADANFNGGLSKAIVKAFRKRMQQIRSAADERLFYALKSLHFEKLEGDRKHQHSMMLNDQWRLIVKFEGESPNKIVVIVEITDYH
ncbi:MAG: type II toxin-antitoxin system RelE/ParE family toxin [Acidobacteria bacterium]|nr:type II toxin-antitoxin system RelE/ParE family toxin [Acidobacteriota bacterium]